MGAHYGDTIIITDWYGDLSKICLKTDTHAHSVTNYDDICIA